MAANDLSDFIQKRQENDSANDSGETEINADQRRTSTDKLILSCLMATLSSSILTNAAGSTGVRELWVKLEEKFNGLSRTHVMDLKRKLISIKKTDIMETYLDHLNEIVQKLNMANCHIDDEDLVFHTLNGLPDDTCRSLK